MLRGQKCACFLKLMCPFQCRTQTMLTRTETMLTDYLVDHQQKNLQLFFNKISNSQ